jgi:hypothetical protein
MSDLLTFVLRRYYFSDAHVRGPVSEEEVLSAQAYILFYEQDPEAAGEGKAEAPRPSESDVEEGSDSGGVKAT